ncbi:eukaryotic mitochondrial regulator protein-domain-containing protein [Zychaea mexicana]|uniref:eukaryotic mitochondrial regulator protein-domain-containing protein n=1 Tax=Zychaea mexicana TaxID=64656 RepID=UPI0022FE2B7D|nr:eukaryotic mitochondrial regulator protein-domain-containing protein [Zychaea mexicana]KAI9492388.1 eukaryotic mitochondrial regulator protein-domain-containing protein [Zychaea mexicana]
MSTQMSRLIRPAIFRAQPTVFAAPRVENQRLFSCTSRRWNEEKPEATAAADEVPQEEQQTEEPEPVKLSRRRRRFHEWAREGGGARFARPSQGTTNYLSTTPFPSNPLFQPRPPLTDAARQEIYDTFTENPEDWSIRKLATKYGISMRRVEAVLKLKEAEKELEMNGVALQKKFAKGMEKLMGADQSVTPLIEPLVDIFPKVKKPTFSLVEEDAAFTEQDAAKALNRQPYKVLEERAIAREEAKFANTRSNASQAPTNSKKKTFVIVDTSR